MSNPAALVQKLSNHGNIQRDDGLSSGDCVGRLTSLLFLKMADGQARPPFSKSWLFPSPPITPQTRIMVEVERRLSVVEELEATVSANLQRAARLRQSILQKAFSGKLA